MHTGTVDAHAAGARRAMNDQEGGAAGYHLIHSDESLNFQCNRWLEAIGPEALAEISAAVAGVRSYEQWISAFLALAESARGQDRRVPAAYYDRAAEFFMSPADPRRAPARARFLAELRAAHRVAPTAVPYAGREMLAYDLAPEGQARETVVVFGGFDSYIEEFLPLLFALVAEGYRVVAFEGPGQGSTLEDSGLPMTPAWERPTGAVLDHFGLGEITAVGVSLGGCLVLRAAAFEPRIARAIAFDVLDDMLEVVGVQVGGRLGAAVGHLVRLLLAARADRVLDAVVPSLAPRRAVTEWGLRQGMHVAAGGPPSEYLRLAAALNTRRISARVRADVLLLAGADDHFVPRRQLQRQAAALTGARSVTTRLFTSAEQASSHCQVGNRGLAVRTMVDWIEGLRSERASLRA